MTRVFFVTDSAGLVGYLQHRGALQRSIGDSGNVLGTSSRRSVKMIAATMSRNFGRFPSKHDITVHATQPPASCVAGMRKPEHTLGDSGFIFRYRSVRTMVDFSHTVESFEPFLDSEQAAALVKIHPKSQAASQLKSCANGNRTGTTPDGATKSSGLTFCGVGGGFKIP